MDFWSFGSGKLEEKTHNFLNSGINGVVLGWERYSTRLQFWGLNSLTLAL